MRAYRIERSTKETEITLELNIDGRGESNIDTGVPFLDHMLTLFSKHSRMDLTVKCIGDTDVDAHHTTEDVGICLGTAFHMALTSDDGMRGITRYADTTLPMDEALILSAVDISGRGHLEYAADIPSPRVGGFDTELCEEFFAAFARRAEITLHIRQLAGRNSHHIIEGMFKSVARSIRRAAERDAALGDEIPSTKGVI